MVSDATVINRAQSDMVSDVDASRLDARVILRTVQLIVQNSERRRAEK